MKKELTEFGKTVKKALIDKNMNQSELAEAIGTSQTYLCKILYGKKNDKIYSRRIIKVLDLASVCKVEGD